MATFEHCHTHDWAFSKSFYWHTLAAAPTYTVLWGGLTEFGFECVKPEGTFYLFVKSPEDNEQNFVARAKAHNLILVAGSTFAMPGYVRIAYCVSPDVIKRSMPHFADLAAEYGLKNGI